MWGSAMQTHTKVSLLLMALVFTSFFVGLGSSPLFDFDEGAFAECTREMLTTGNLTTPHLGGQPYYDKPILTYWCQALFAKCLGLHEIAFRLPSALAGALWAFLLWHFAREFLGSASAGWTVLFLATTLHIILTVRVATSDALLNCLLAASMLAFYRYHSGGAPRNLYSASTFMALGVLAKGPVAVVIPVVVTFLFCALQRDLKRWSRALINPVAVIIFLAIAVPWHLAAWFENGDAFIDSMLWHNLSRYRDVAMEGHTGGFLYYLPFLLVFLLPHTGVMLVSLVRAFRDTGTPLVRFMLIWFCFVVLFFSFSVTKLPHYVIPAYAPLFILTARYFPNVRSSFWLFAPALALALIYVLAPVLVWFVSAHSDDPYIVAVATAAFGHFGIGYYTVAVAGALLALVLMFLRSYAPTWRVTVVSVLLMLILNLGLTPAIGLACQGHVRDAAWFAKDKDLDVQYWRLGRPGITLMFPSFMVYRQAIVPHARGVPRGACVLTKTTALNDLGPHTVLFQRSGLTIAQAAPPEDGAVHAEATVAPEAASD